MKIENAVVLVTGANRGIGRAFARELLARGAGKVYAGARDPATVTQSGVQALRLDVNRREDVTAAAALAPDVTLIINKFSKNLPHPRTTMLFEPLTTPSLQLAIQPLQSRHKREVEDEIEAQEQR
jgi:NAD(P)-dependent dehydrogenase (short-subunit alcohol dehydrogenase family)